MQKDNFIILMAVAVVLVMGFWYLLSSSTQVSAPLAPAPIAPITADNGDTELGNGGLITADLAMVATACLEEGAWLAEVNECENVSSEWCEQAGGIFDDCASACRHLEDAEMCIMQCIPVCYFQ